MTARPFHGSISSRMATCQSIPVTKSNAKNAPPPLLLTANPDATTTPTSRSQEQCLVWAGRGRAATSRRGHSQASPRQQLTPEASHTRPCFSSPPDIYVSSYSGHWRLGLGSLHARTDQCATLSAGPGPEACENVVGPVKKGPGPVKISLNY